MDDRLTRLDLKTSLSALASLALPGWCIACGCRLNMREKFLCLRCMADLPLTHFETLPRNPMADRYNGAIGNFLEEYEPYQWATALIHYNSFTGFANIPRDLKYHRNTVEGRYFASLLAGTLRKAPHLADVDLIVPVPLHWTRRLSRGYNQAEVIAREISKALGVPADTRLLRRCRKTLTQTRISVEDKAANVEGAFAVVPGRAARKNTVRHILLVDDVMTSGATLSQCHKALRRYFAADIRISCATLAFAG